MISFSLQAGNLFQVLILLCFGTLEKAVRLLQLQSKIFPGSMRHENTTQFERKSHIFSRFSSSLLFCAASAALWEAAAPPWPAPGLAFSLNDKNQFDERRTQKLCREPVFSPFNDALVIPAHQVSPLHIKWLARLLTVSANPAAKREHNYTRCQSPRVLNLMTSARWICLQPDEPKPHQLLLVTQIH